MIKCTGTKKVTWKITDPKRWKSVKESITWTEGILVNFLNQQENYRSAYQYILKKVNQSTTVASPWSGRYILPTSQKVNKTLQGLSESHVLWHFYNFRTPSKKLSKSKSKSKRLSRLEVSKFMVKNNIQRTTVICCSRWKKERRSGICAVMFTNAKCKGYPWKTGKI